jgi:DNA primase
MFKCFGCGESGDIFRFVMKIEGVEFGDALRILAKRAGVRIERERPEFRTKRKKLYDINELACCFYEKQLKESQTGKRVRDYLLKRGIEEKSIEKWRLGYAPAPTSGNWQILSDFLVSKGFQRSDIESVGLAIKSSKSNNQGQANYYDRFRGRIMFPVFDLYNQVIGFGGRLFEEKAEKKDLAKYLNIPNTLLYNKSNLLYGLNFGRVDIRKKDYCILVEGYTDVILSHQAGFENTVAASGTSLTESQLRILKRYSQNLITAFDMDIAGDFATKRGIDLAHQAGFQIKVAVMPQGKDPADIISENPKQWQKLIGSAKSIFDFYFDSTFEKFDEKSEEGKRNISNILLSVIGRVPNKIVQAHWAQELARRLKVSEEAVLSELKSVINRKKVFKEPVQDNSQEIKEPEKKTRKAALEERVLSLILRSPENISLISEECLNHFSGQSKELLSCLKKSKNYKIENFEKNVPESLKDFFNELCLKGEIEEEEDPKEEFRSCLKELEKIFNRERLQEIAVKIQEAEEKKDAKAIKKLSQEFNNTLKEINNNKQYGQEEKNKKNK